MYASVEVQMLPGRGRGLVTTCHIDAGEVVLAEEPLLLTVLQECKDQACANCLSWLEQRPGALQCQQCHQVAFCSPACQQQAAARPWVHAAATCRAYASIPALLPGDADAQTSLRGLIQAAALKAAGAAAGTAAAAAAAGGGDGSSVALQCAAGYQVLLGLQGSPSPAHSAAAPALHAALCAAIGHAHAPGPGSSSAAGGSSALLTVDEVAALLAKEATNSYGLLAPLATQHHKQQRQGGSVRRLRGGAIYPLCALINHECLPNVARFDALDAAAGAAGGSGARGWPAQWPGVGGQPPAPAPAVLAAAVAGAGSAAAAAAGLSAGPPVATGSGGASSSTLVVMRALHALPPGTEVCVSYVPLNWSLEERQAQAQQVYGFSCRCPRCLLEASPAWQQQQAEGGSDGGDSSGWETDSGAGGEQQAGDAASGGSDTAMHVDDDSAADDGAAAAGERLDPAYLSLFVLKYVCPADGCGGTMAALRAAHGQQAQQGEVLECSVCGALRSEAEFLAELEA